MIYSFPNDCKNFMVSSPNNTLVFDRVFMNYDYIIIILYSLTHINDWIHKICNKILEKNLLTIVWKT